MAKSGAAEATGLSRVVSLKDRAARFAQAGNLAEIRPDLTAEDPGRSLDEQRKEAIATMIRHSGPRYRLDSLARIVRARRQRGMP